MKNDKITSVVNRRKFLKGSVVASAVATASAPAIISAKTKQLKMVTSWPKNFPGLGTSANRFAKRIEKSSKGRYKITVYAGGELVHPLKCLDAVQEGTADLYHSAEYYYKGKTPAFAFFTTVPFGFTTNELDAWLHHGGGQKLWDELSSQFGVKALPCTNTGMQMGGWFKKPVNSLRDLKGIKMRTPGLGGDVLNALGGNAISLAASEIMPALQSNTIDAAEWVGPWNDLAFGFYKVVKNYMYPGPQEPGTMVATGISKKLWDKLSEEDQLIFEQAAATEYNYGFAEFNANNGAALNTLINQHGVNLFECPDEVFRAYGEATSDILLDVSKKDAITKKIYNSFIKFHREVRGWTKVSDQSYTNKRDLFNL